MSATTTSADGPGQSGGTTPVRDDTGNRFGVNAISIISPRGKKYFTVCASTFTVASCIEFLKRVIRQTDRKVHLILDGHSVHRSRTVRDRAAANTDEIEVHFLPSYAPHLNPDELVNADLKRNLGDRTINEMRAEVTGFFRQVPKLPRIIQGNFRGPHVQYTVETIN